MNPLAHYLTHGAREGRSPSPKFDSHFYFEWALEADRATDNPLLRYYRDFVQSVPVSPSERRLDALVRAINTLRPAQCVSADLVPDVSILIAGYNHVDYTLSCIRSVLAQPTRFRYEIIVMDDSSTEEWTMRFLRRVKPIRLFQTAANQGFLRTCNEGAAKAGQLSGPAQ